MKKLFLVCVMLVGCSDKPSSRDRYPVIRLEMHAINRELDCIGGCGEKQMVYASSDPDPTFECDDCARKHEKWSEKKLTITEDNGGWRSERCPECNATREPHCVGTTMVLSNLGGDFGSERQSIPALKFYCSKCKNHFAHVNEGQSAEERPFLSELQ